MADGFCAPTVIYLILAVLSIAGHMIPIALHPGSEVHVGNTSLSKTGLATGSLLVSILVTAFFTWVLYKLCANGHEGWAWAVIIFIFIVPLLMVLALFGVAFHIFANSKKEKFASCNYCS